ncbi:MAG: 4Fe-4S dicluster domain-containing protein [Firmicutes bacterium]|nr:4Fe-4S dicluster domain-containing protein [Bacillota bacterium]
MIFIHNKKECTGCYACFNICSRDCITMEPDSEGFYYPEVDYSKCVKCGSCIMVCPTKNRTTVRQWNIKAYACINKNSSIRQKSSSGGIFSLLAENVISKGGVVFGAVFTDNFVIQHSYIENKEEIGKMRGSKYVQSSIGHTFKQAKEFLDRGRYVFFSGTPCQISGLKKYLGQNYNNLLCQDLICHGVPSPMVWRKYLTWKEQKAGAKATKVSFRSKTKGWRNYSLYLQYENGTQYSKTINDDLYLVGFNNNLYLRPSCYACPFKTAFREADITLADFWGIQSIEPAFNDDKGVSLVLIHSVKGENIFDELKDKMECKQVNFNEAIRYNPAMLKSMTINSNREKFFSEIASYDFGKLMNKYCKEKLVIRLKKKIRNAAKAILIYFNLFDEFKKVYRRGN